MLLSQRVPEKGYWCSFLEPRPSDAPSAELLKYDLSSCGSKELLPDASLQSLAPLCAFSGCHEPSLPKLGF